MKKVLAKLFDWFSQTTSPRWTLDFEDFLSVVRTAIMAGASAAVTELASTLAREYASMEPNKVLAYIIVAVLLQTIRKWAGQWQ
ncbi:MAG: hypothetical protein QW761_00115 [Candidatus Aenigmatarchaeota archaeon]